MASSLLIRDPPSFDRNALASGGFPLTIDTSFMLPGPGVGAFDETSSWVMLRRFRTPLTVSSRLPCGCATVTLVGGFGVERSAATEGR